MSDREEELIKRVRAELDRGAASLDELTVARLRAARKRALDAPRGRRVGWLATGVGVATATAGLAAWLVFTPAGVAPMQGVEALDLLTEADPELYRELEFYRWLAEQRRAG